MKSRSTSKIGILAAGMAAVFCGAGSTVPDQTIPQHLRGEAFQSAPANTVPVRQALPPASHVRSISFFNNIHLPFIGARQAGMTPKEWGMSDQCRRMVRHGRMTRKGIGAARI